MKPERNDLCPCGSGKKFKKCCIDKPIVFEKHQEKKSGESIFFSKYNSIDLLKSIAALSILPENHGKNVRLELLSLSALRNHTAETQNASLKDLKTFTTKEYPSHYLEDPPTNLFTDLVTFHGGDYLIFPGITETGSFILSNLLTAIFQWPDANLPKQFKANCTHALLLILNISDAIATKMGYSRYQKGTATIEAIEFPSDEIFNQARQSVAFAQSEMVELLNENGISKAAILEFIIDTKQVDFNDASIEDSPLMERPIIETDSEYLVVSPNMLSLSVTNFIWNQATEFGCTKEVEEAYNAVVWNDVQFHLKNMDFIRIEQTAELASSLGAFENLYRFDKDKIAHIRLIAPSRIRTSQTHPVARKSSEEILSKLLEKPDFKDHKFLDISLISGTGQDSAHSIMKNKNAKVIAIHLFEFEVLAELKKSDAIDLWNFATAIDEQLIERPMMTFSFLDLYKIYKDKDDSLYISDENNANFIHVQPGYAADLIFKAKHKKDVHSIVIEEKNKLYRVPVVRKDKYAPIYCNPNDLLSNILRFAIEGFYQPVWVKPNFALDTVHGEFRSMVFQLNDAVAYWLWQTCDEVKDFLKLLKNKPLIVSYDLAPIEKFRTLDRNFERVLDLFGKFKWSSSSSRINLQIPAELIPYLYGSDNEGERVLVKSLLFALNDLLAANSLPLIEIESILAIVDKCAPFGMKKKFFILDSNDNMLLDQRNLVEERCIQEYNVNLVLNSILPGLGKHAPPVGEIKTKADKEKLTRDIVVRSLLPSLKSAISQYDCEELLKELIQLNETLIEKRELYRVNTPSRIACFVSVEQHAIDLKEALSNINRTTLALRCLSEHVAAEQARGTKTISTTGLDELIALMDQIIAWGSIGDQVKFELFDIDLSILASGRVGTEKSKVNEVLEPYHEMKIGEDIYDAVNSYDSVFPQRLSRADKDTPEFIDKAFHDDFKISFTRICELVEGLSIIAFESNKSFIKVPFKELRDRVNKIVETFSEEELNHCIEFLALKKRAKVEVPPSGFDSIDISPWRFNRRLSVLRKPVIVVENSKDSSNPFLYWGPRQILLSRQYLGEQCLSGRLKVSEDGNVIRALGRLAQEKGDSLVKKVVKNLSGDEIKLFTEVWIGPNEFLYDEKDLGDVDVLIIDKRSKTIYSLECKSIEPSRNIKEMVEEVSKLFGSDSERGWIQKHADRDLWLKNNKELLSKKYNEDLKDYEVKSFFVTNEGMVTPFLKGKKLPIPFVSKYDLEKSGLAALS